MKRKQASLAELWGQSAQTSSPVKKRKTAATIVATEHARGPQTIITPMSSLLSGTHTSTVPPETPVATHQASTARHSAASNDIPQTRSLPVRPATRHVNLENSSPVATNQYTCATAPFQPFAEREVYMCPFLSKGQCSAGDAFFDTYKKLCGHIISDHNTDSLASSYAEDPSGDGTRKVPCPRGCDGRFVTHQKANHHAKTAECPQPKRDIIPCSWPNCPFIANGKDPEKGMANHIRAKHSRDDTSPYQCSKCSEYYHHDLYKLAMHEERCRAQSVATIEKTSLRFKLNQAAQEHRPPTYIVVVRSSNRILEGWKAGTDSYLTGLPVLGKKILAHFAAKVGSSDGAAVLHAAYECPTRRVPALARDLSYLETQNHQKKMVWRGFKFTQAIVADIKAANEAGIKPFVISQGIDGFFCDVTIIHPWLHQSSLTF
ncbi:hypothetical protein E8E12_007372 [Didymella heteroderae]|uniref:Uncharacterized protein n=1 Tax=Didymella heteroderae TaxID=1769908 RepID=A0A9P5C3V2_9PLEO|nr:hypothetical protein E8E12_007372 [Didymella heteroderae]